MAAESEQLEEEIETPAQAEPSEGASGSADNPEVAGASADQADNQANDQADSLPASPETSADLADESAVSQVEPPDSSEAADDSVPTEAVESDPTASNNLEQLLTMRVPVIVRIAQKRIQVADVLKFNLGSVIQFDQDAYQHIDLMVNNTVIGLGQAIKIGENFGLKITQIADIADTIKSLGGQKPN